MFGKLTHVYQKMGISKCGYLYDQIEKTESEMAAECDRENLRYEGKKSLIIHSVKKYLENLKKLFLKKKTSQ